MTKNGFCDNTVLLAVVHNIAERLYKYKVICRWL